MSAHDLPDLTGSCLCGAVAISVSGKPLMTAACHCTLCQKMTASAYSLSHVYPRGAVKIEAGTPVIGGTESATRHYFCAKCMTWIYSHPAQLDDIAVVRTAIFDPVPPCPPFVDMFRANGLAWAQTGATHSFDGVPPEGGFAELIAEYGKTQTA